MLPYLKRVNSLPTLHKFVAGIDVYSPSEVKILASKALSLYDDINRIHRHTAFKIYKDKWQKPGKCSVELEKISLILQERVNYTNPSDWSHYELLPLMSLLSITCIPIKSDMKTLFESKLSDITGLNMCNIANILIYCKRLHLDPNIPYFLSYIRENIDYLLERVSLRDIYLLLNALQFYKCEGTRYKLDHGTLSAILEYLNSSKTFKEFTYSHSNTLRGLYQDVTDVDDYGKLTFKDLANTMNAVSRHVSSNEEIGYTFIPCGSEHVEIGTKCRNDIFNLDDTSMNVIYKFFNNSYGLVSQFISLKMDDFDGIVDVIDSFAKLGIVLNISEDVYNRIIATVSTLYDRIDDYLSRTYPNSKRFDGIRLRVLMKDLIIFRLHRRTTIAHISSSLEMSTSWSIGGILDYFSGVSFFGASTLSDCHNKYLSKILNAHKAHIRSCEDLSTLLISSLELYYSCHTDLLERLLKMRLKHTNDLYMSILTLYMYNCGIFNRLSIGTLSALNRGISHHVHKIQTTCSGDVDESIKIVQDQMKKLTFRLSDVTMCDLL